MDVEFCQGVGPMKNSYVADDKLLLAVKDGSSPVQKIDPVVSLRVKLTVGTSIVLTIISSEKAEQPPAPVS